MARRGSTIILTLLGVIVLCSVAMFVALILLVGRGPSVPSNATLTLRLGGDLAETSPDNVVGYLSGTRTPIVRAIVDNLRKAKVDRRVATVLLKETGFTTPYWGKIQEIRDAILDFKKSGKPIYAYLEYGGDRDYYLATAADKVFMLPSSPLDLTGVATYELFFRGTLDKIGAYPDIHRIGDYKTAANTFTEKTMTRAHREMDESLNRALYDQIVAGIAAGRNKPDAEVRTLIDDGPFLADQAKRLGLIDDVAYEDQVEEKLQPGSNKKRVNGEDYATVATSSVGLDRGPRIAVIYASGAIVGGESGFDPLNGSVLGSDTLIEYIRQARRDSSIRAIVLRIDSPGGSAAASDAIWRELMIAKQERANRPIVASMSDLAASGGYYIAMPADAIVAQPATLTGSIGIFGGKFITGGAYEKLGMHIESTSIGKHAEMNSPVRPYNESELKKITEQLDEFYQQFVERAAESRHSTPEKIDRLAQGRVWTGSQARENGLVDELGGLDQAIAVAKARANIDAGSSVEIVPFPGRKSFFQIMSEQLTRSEERSMAGFLAAANLSSAERQALRALRGPLSLFRRGELLALMPMAFLQ